MRRSLRALCGCAGTSTTLAGVPRTPAASLIQGGSKANAIALAERAQKQLRVQEALTVAQQMDLSPSWIEVDAKKFAGVFKSVPDRADLPADINEALIVELYSK